MFPQKTPVLLLKTSLAMMTFLLTDVVPHNLNLRGIHRKGSIPGLPLKRLQIMPLAFQPPAGIRFENGDPTGHRDCPRQNKKDMNMILHPANFQRATALVSQNSAKVGVEFRANPV